MRQVVSDIWPLNARVEIEYGRERKVKFGYPVKVKKRLALAGYTLSPILVVWAVVSVIVFAFLIAASATAGVVWSWEGESWQFAALAVFWLAVPFLMSIYVALDYKRFSVVFPKLNYYVSKYLGGRPVLTATIHGSEMRRRVFEVPMFKNIFLDYRAVGEFAKCLKKVVIREHDFKFVEKARGKRILKPQNALWKATFVFRKVPKSGRLDVDFL